MARHQVVIVGSGFGALFAARKLSRSDVDITIISKTNNHLFQPLLYQVATSILSEGEVAPCTREVLRWHKNVTVLLGLVEGFDLANKTVSWRYLNEEQVTSYDTLIVAAGAGQSYFGNDHFAEHASGLKTVDDALEIRARILQAFEAAELTEDPEEIDRLLTFVVVGAGPTGVELAGQIRELADATIHRDFRRIDPKRSRIILMDAAPQVLPPFGPKLGKKAQQKLEQIGVEVMLNAMVTDVNEHEVEYKNADGEIAHIPSFCKIWAAGVQGSELSQVLADQSDAEVDRASRIKVNPDLTVPGRDDVFAIGDMAFLDGVPGVAQAAIQEAHHVADIIDSRLKSTPHPGDFSYYDRGSMATISKFSAVAQVRGLEFTGFIAWVLWLVLHLLYIAGFKQRITTLLNWFITFLSNGRSQRVITNQQLVGRLALSRLGSRSSGRLLKGKKIDRESPTKRV